MRVVGCGHAQPANGRGRVEGIHEEIFRVGVRDPVGKVEAECVQIHRVQGEEIHRAVVRPVGGESLGGFGVGKEIHGARVWTQLGTQRLIKALLIVRRHIRVEAAGEGHCEGFTAAVHCHALI